MRTASSGQQQTEQRFLTRVGTGSDGHFKVTTEGTERFRCDSSGRLLVGTSTVPSNKNSVTPTFAISASGVNGAAQITRHTSVGAGGALLELSATRGTSNTDYTILQSGDGIGTVDFLGADGNEFVVAAAIQAAVDGTPGDNDMPGRLVFSTTADGASSPTERMRITSAGRVIFGATAATAENELFSFQGNNFTLSQFQVTGGASQIPIRTHNTATSGTRNHILFMDGGGTVRGSITTDGSSTAFNTSSDYRLKENVELLTGATERLSQIPVHRFNFIGSEVTVDGFIAHEVQTVVPEAVIGEKDAVNEDGSIKPQGIDQSKLVPLLTAALQEAIGEIESLKARVAVLEAN